MLFYMMIISVWEALLLVAGYNKKMNAYDNKTIALAGAQQALCGVQNIAWTGNFSQSDFDICLRSIFVRDPENYEDVFGNIQNIQSGLRALQTSFKDKRNKEAVERTRYMVSLMLLAKKVQPDNPLAQQIGTTLSLLDEAVEDLENQRDYIIERLAQLYQNTLSKLTPRIIVYGQPEILENQHNAAAIRAQLLAALRAIILWYQAGGSQLNLLTGKSRYLQHIDNLLS